MARRPFSKLVRVQEERSGPSEADQGLSPEATMRVTWAQLGCAGSGKVDDQELVRSKKVKCLGAVLDDGLIWRDKYQEEVFFVHVVWQS